MPEQWDEEVKGMLFISYSVDKFPYYYNLNKRPTSKYSIKRVLSILEPSPCTLQ